MPPVGPDEVLVEVKKTVSLPSLLRGDEADSRASAALTCTVSFFLSSLFV